MKKIIELVIFSFTYSLMCDVNAQTPTIKWWFDVKDASFGQSAAGDIDGDGKLEVVFGCYRNDSCVYALNAENGTLLWKYNTHSTYAEGCNDVAPIIYDLDGDDSLEVIVPSSCNNKTFCFNGTTGEVKWICDTRGSDSPPTLADINGDDIPDILHGEFGGYVICINGNDGTPLWEIPVDLNSWIQTAPTIVDLDNDSQLDVVVATWNNVDRDSNAIYAYRCSDQSLIWKYNISDVVYHGTAVANLDDDAFPELIIGCYNDTLYCLNGENGTVKWKYASDYYIGSPATIADIDGDNDCDVVFTSFNKVIALTSGGELKWEYTIPNAEQSFRGCALADINNDMLLDAIFGTDGGKVIALNGFNGTKIFTVDLALHYGNDLFAIDHAPLIADFDNDDSLEIFIVGGHATYPDFENNFGRAYLITTGVGSGPEWLMFQQDIHRKSSLCEKPFTFICEKPLSNTASVKVFPNPAKDFITFQLPKKENEIYSLTIFNSLGQQIYKIENISSMEICLQTENWNKSFYFFKLQDKKGNISQGKFIFE